MNLNVLIIGANGFIGKNLASNLSKISHINLTLISRTISEELKVLTNYRARYISLDFKNTLELVGILSKNDLVYHLVSSSFPSNSWRYPLRDITDNLIPSIQLMEACVDSNIKKIVFISSGGTVYGRQDKVLNESDPLKPFSPYGIVKATTEYFLEYFSLKSNIAYDIYRVSNAYGPHLDKPGFGVINTWLKLVSQNRELVLIGDGSAKKDYIYIDDLVEMLKYSIQKETLTKSNVFNASSGKVYSLNDLLTLIEAITSSKLKILRKGGLKSDNSVVNLSNHKILSLLKDLKITSLEEGVFNTWKWVNKN